MNEKFNKNVKVEQLTNMFLSRGEERGLIVKDPYKIYQMSLFQSHGHYMVIVNSYFKTPKIYNKRDMIPKTICRDTFEIRKIWSIEVYMFDLRFYKV